MKKKFERRKVTNWLRTANEYICKQNGIVEFWMRSKVKYIIIICASMLWRRRCVCLHWRTLYENKIATSINSFRSFGHSNDVESVHYSKILSYRRLNRIKIAKNASCLRMNKHRFCNVCMCIERCCNIPKGVKLYYISHSICRFHWTLMHFFVVVYRANSYCMQTDSFILRKSVPRSIVNREKNSHCCCCYFFDERLSNIVAIVPVIARKQRTAAHEIIIKYLYAST